MTCRHVYEITGKEICDECNRPTHETDWEISAKIIRDHYKNGDDLKYICDECGGTIRMWWSI